MNNFEYKKAGSVHDAVAAFSDNPDVFYIGGGTNLLDLWKYDLTHPKTLVDVSSVSDEIEIREKEDGGLCLSARATNAATAYHPLVEQRYPLLSRAILAAASAQIRNMATNGGNLLQRTRCHYFYDSKVPCNKREPGTGCPAKEGRNRMHAILGASDSCIAVFPSDMCVALAALEAVVNVEGPNGKRSIAFEDFHRLPDDVPEFDNNLHPGELITSIDLPSEGFAENYSYLKIRDRKSYSFALVSVATGLRLEGEKIREARIALGGVAHKPWRRRKAEQHLIGKEASPENFAAAAEILLEGAKPYKYNGFKIDLAKKAIVRNCMMALNPETQRPGAKPSA